MKSRRLWPWCNLLLHLARHVTSQHDMLPSPCILAYGKVMMKRDETCRIVSRLSDSTTSATGTTRTTRVQGCRHSVDWGGHVHLTFSRSCSRDWRKSKAQKIKLLYASTTLLYGPPCWNKHGSTCRTCRVVSRRDVTSRVKVGFKPAVLTTGLSVKPNRRFFLAVD